MKVDPNPRYDAMVDILRRHRKTLRPWQGVVFRAAMLPYARAEKLIDGKGAYRHGSRWCAPRAFRCVNLSTSTKTSLQESQASALYYGLKEADLQPRVLVGVRLKLHRLLHLVAGTTLAEELVLTDILAEDWRGVNNGGHESLGQALGRVIHDLGEEGIMAPSAQVKGGANIVVFSEALRPRSRMEVVGREELDHWLKKH